MELLFVVTLSLFVVLLAKCVVSGTTNCLGGFSLHLLDSLVESGMKIAAIVILVVAFACTAAAEDEEREKCMESLRDAITPDMVCVIGNTVIGYNASEEYATRAHNPEIPLRCSWAPPQRHLAPNSNS